MGLGDNRRSPKMRRKVRQAQKKARDKRRREAHHTKRGGAKTPAKGEKKK